MIGLVLAGLGVSHKVVHGASYEDNVGVSSAVSNSLHVFIGTYLQCLEYQMLQGATWFTFHLRQPTAATPLG